MGGDRRSPLNKNILQRARKGNIDAPPLIFRVYGIKDKGRIQKPEGPTAINSYPRAVGREPGGKNAFKSLGDYGGEKSGLSYKGRRGLDLRGKDAT